jgi:hypothetical protein
MSHQHPATWELLSRVESGAFYHKMSCVYIWVWEALIYIHQSSSNFKTDQSI